MGEVRTIYRAYMRWGGPTLLKLTVDERPKTYKIVDQETLLGEKSYDRVLNKDTGGLFDEPKIAARYLIKLLEERASTLRERQKKTLDETKAMWTFLEKLDEEA